MKKGFRHWGLALLLLACEAQAQDSDRVRAFRKAYKGADVQDRVSAVKTLASTWDPEAVSVLATLLEREEDPLVLTAILAEAVAHPDEGATALLKVALTLRQKSAWEVRGAAVLALLARNAPGDFDLASLAAQDKDGRVLQIYCDGLGESLHEKVLDALGPLLAHEDWRVRSAAVAALGRRKGTPQSDPAVALLVDRLKSEQDRLVGDILGALRKLTGQDLGPDPAAWVAWLRRQRAEEEVSFPRGEEAFTGRPGVTYHGVTTYSKRLIFVFDRTGSMLENDRITKEKKHLVETIRGFGKAEGLDAYDRKKVPPVSFNILMFSNGQVEPWRPAPVLATEENKRSAITFVEEQQAIGWTNTWTAMKAALDMACRRRRGAYDRGEADTIFLMTDGMPSLPPGNVADDWAKIADQIRDYNRVRRIAIHTVGCGQAFAPFMRRVAEENGGTFIMVP